MKYFSLMLSLLLLSSCGFSPIYGDHQGKYGQSYAVEETLSLIKIDTIPDREGQFLRNILIDQFYRHGYPTDTLYTLHVAPIDERLVDLDITINSDSTRGQLILKTNFVLRNSDTGEARLSRKMQAITSYNILASEFTNRVSEQNARENALRDLARQIELQIALHFRR